MYVSLHPIFVSCLIFRERNYDKKTNHVNGGGLFFQQEWLSPKLLLQVKLFLRKTVSQ